MMMSYAGNMEIGRVAKPPVAYGNAVKLTPSATGEPRQDLPGKVARPLEPAQTADLSPEQPEALAARRRPMESRSDPTVLYLHPDGKYELKRYALARGAKVKVHDLIIEAVEEWGERHGISAPFRVPSQRPRRG